MSNPVVASTARQFAPLRALPGWEACDGRVTLCSCGRLRFLRTIRRIGEPRRVYCLATDTPRAFDLLIEDFAARRAVAEEVA